MRIDFHQLESLTTSKPTTRLVKLGCSTEVLKNAVYRYAFAHSRPKEFRKGLRRAGVTHKQIRRRIAAARDLKAFLDQRVRPNLHLFAPQLPNGQSEALSIILWRDELERIAAFIEALYPPRLNANDAALSLVMHIKEKTKKRRLPTDLKLAVLELLNSARSAAGIPRPLTLDALDKQTARASRENARRLLHGWDWPRATTAKR